ncbi:hypothetical protein Tco_0745107 [Tanacetum coccineum]
MVISVISVSSDSSKDNVGTSTGRVILFGTIPTTIPDTTLSVIPPTTYIDTTLIPIISPTIPPSPDYTPTSPDYSPTSDTEFDPSEDPSSDHISPLPATSPFLSVGIKNFLMLFEVTAARVVNVADTKLQLLKRLRLLEDFLLSEKG